MLHTGWNLLRRFTNCRSTFIPSSSPDHPTCLKTSKAAFKNVIRWASTEADEKLMYFTSLMVHRSCNYDVSGDVLGHQLTSILKTTGLQAEDFIHVSFHDEVRVDFLALGGKHSNWDSFNNLVSVFQVYQVPFFVALDHKRGAVVVAVRGTLSIEASLCFFFSSLFFFFPLPKIIHVRPIWKSKKQFWSCPAGCPDRPVYWMWTAAHWWSVWRLLCSRGLSRVALETRIRWEALSGGCLIVTRSLVCFLGHLQSSEVHLQ